MLVFCLWVLLFTQIFVILANAGIHLSLQLKCLRNLDSRVRENDRVNRRTRREDSSAGTVFRDFVPETPRQCLCFNSLPNESSDDTKGSSGSNYAAHSIGNWNPLFANSTKSECRTIAESGIGR